MKCVEEEKKEKPFRTCPLIKPWAAIVFFCALHLFCSLFLQHTVVFFFFFFLTGFYSLFPMRWTHRAKRKRPSSPSTRQSNPFPVLFLCILSVVCIQDSAATQIIHNFPHSKPASHVLRIAKERMMKQSITPRAGQQPGEWTM